MRNREESGTRKKVEVTVRENERHPEGQRERVSGKPNL